MRSAERLAEASLSRRPAAIAIVLALLLVVSGGIVFLEAESTFEEVQIGSEEEAALDRIERDFAVDNDVTAAQIVVETDDPFAKEALLASLDLQRAVRAHPDVADTLIEDDPTMGLANLVAYAAAERDGTRASSLTIEEQRELVAAMSQDEIDAVGERLLTSESAHTTHRFLPNDVESAGEADSTMIVVAHTIDSDVSAGTAPDRIVDAQLAIHEIAEDRESDVRVVGNGLLTHEMDQSTADTLALLGPMALGLVLAILTLAYRRVLDLVVSLAGIVLVLLWTFGALGWLGVAFNPILIAIPVFLIGLSIDFGIHVLMRYRERRGEGDRSQSAAMATALAGVGMALVWITLTTATGFLSNLVSPMQPIRELGLMAAIGIVGAFVVFVGLVPLVKVEIEERFGGASDARAIGTGDGRVGRGLAGAAAVATRAPVTIVLVTLLVSSVAAGVAIGVDTTFDHTDNVPDDAPAWTVGLPGPFAPGEYAVRDDLEYIDDRYLREESQAELLIEGDVTDPAVLREITAALADATEAESTVVLATGDPVATTPITVMYAIAAEHPDFAESLAAADTTGDGIPDRDLAALYDEMWAYDPDRAATVIDREDGEVRALRATVAVAGDVDGDVITADVREVAAAVEDAPVAVTATGVPITHHLIDQALVRTVLASLFVTLAVVGGLLMVVFRRVHGSASLGLVTLLPVALAVAWIIATVDLLGYSLNVVTALTASLTIGIGIDYSIHVTERFGVELERADSTAAAIAHTIRGTGGALLGSAATTAVGFGVLAFAINPMLQQFGLITAIMIAYAFIGAVIVLPSLLMLWAKVGCPDPTLACAVAREEGVDPAD